jgi:hypothetical protein
MVVAVIARDQQAVRQSVTILIKAAARVTGCSACAAHDKMRF